MVQIVTKTDFVRKALVSIMNQYVITYPELRMALGWDEMRLKNFFEGDLDTITLFDTQKVKDALDNIAAAR